MNSLPAKGGISSSFLKKMGTEHNPNEKTLCFSIAQHPSKFGTAIMNAAFESEGMNWLYLARAVEPGMLKAAIEGLKVFKIRGCGVSMPFKTEAIQYLDEIDPTSSKIGAINTIVQDDGILRGYNTDYFGVVEVLKETPLTDKSIVLLGAGGMAQAVLGALTEKGATKITICNRSLSKASEVASKWQCTVTPWESRNSLSADILINATSIGMYNNPGIPLEEQALGNFQMVVDVIVDPMESELIRLAKQRSLPTIAGFRISLYRAAKQFELYTGRQAPLEVMEKAMLNLK